MPLVVIEGLDYSGKSTQLSRLLECFPHAYTRSYPDYEGPYGDLFKQFLSGGLKMSVSEQLMLYGMDFARDAAEVVDRVNSGQWVLLDRYYTSTMAYQSLNGSLSIPLISNFFHAVHLPKIDYYIELSLTPEESFSRKREGEARDIFESDLEFIHKLYKAYEQVFLYLPARSKSRVDATQPIDKVFEDILGILGQ